MKRLPIVLSVAALMVASPGLAAASENEPRAAEEYVPFVTDFPQPASAAADPTPSLPRASGVEWSDVGIGLGAAAALAGSALVAARRAGAARGRPAPR